MIISVHTLSALYNYSNYNNFCPYHSAYFFLYSQYSTIFEKFSWSFEKFSWSIFRNSWGIGFSVRGTDVTDVTHGFKD